MNNRYYNLFNQKNGITKEKMLNEIVPHLKKHPEIESINLASNNIDDDTLELFVNNVHKIRSLMLDNNNISPRGIQLLINSRKFIEIQISGNPIQQAGLDMTAACSDRMAFYMDAETIIRNSRPDVNKKKNPANPFSMFNDSSSENENDSESNDDAFRRVIKGS